VPLLSVSCTDFRCLAAAEIRPHAQFTLISGANASGKTSLLEAVSYLGRGRSFRGASTRDLVRHGAKDFVLRGEVETGGLRHRLGVRNGREGLELSIDGDRSGGTARLAAALPLQVIDPEVHELVGGAPDQRRRFMDWMTFHVEHGYLDAWRRFRRALKQRNAALKTGSGSLESWDREFVELALALEEIRKSLVGRAIPVLEECAGGLLELPVSFEYQRGWSDGRGLAEVLREHRVRDQASGTTNSGPHRGDLKLRMDERVARKLVSRGQQKLLACAMVLGSVAVVSPALQQPPLLLLDDPAAELDRGALERLMAAVGASGSQVIATALTPDAVPVPAAHSLFHVEQGVLTAAS
jgi:DNA replication and repair protein RecF